jgi:phosphoribosylanthranilate isomerase
MLARVELEKTGETRPCLVGVFVDASAEEIAACVEECGIDTVQLHSLGGPTAEEVRRAIGARWRRPAEAGTLSSEPAPTIIRAIPVDAEEDDEATVAARVRDFGEGADLLLFDTSKSGVFGGTGVSFRWELVRQAAGARRFLIAGGITPLNAAEALRRSGAWGVDVSGGVEVSPGVKDHRLIEELVKAVQAEGNAE